MNLQDLFNISDVGSIFDEVEEKLKCNLPCGILLPLEQKRFISLGSNDKIEVEVGWLTRHKKFGSCIIKPHEIENPLVVYKFSAKENLRLTDDEWQDVIYDTSSGSAFLDSTSVYETVRVECMSNGANFNIRRMELYRALAADNLLMPKDGKLTFEFRSNGFRQSVICLAVNNIRRYFSGKEAECDDC